ncbi:MAG: alpha-L-arabinofuranosidase C-terminal domain-containing protein [Prevotellaceae bacterium]|nr:alpha-L-arabinofuranosidase C-terminal domain-containing protein [Prevotellaceae bacterium]
MKKSTILIALSLALNVSAQKSYDMVVDASKTIADIQPTMYGIFFEDINFGADGGLYAELIKNRSFEFPQSFVGWTPFGNVTVHDEQPAFPRNPHYVRIVNDGRLLRAGLDNSGYRGIGLKTHNEYRFSVYARTPDSTPIKLSIELVKADGSNPVKKEIEVKGNEWTKYTAVLKSNFTDANSRIRIVVKSKGTVDLDHISLFPVDTWKGRENGLRVDLAQALYDLNPGVFRFPGGCIIEGNSLDTRYQWKNTVGPVENRPLNENRWNYTFKHKAFPDYFQTTGLGFYEYFLLSEDIGAEPLPVISCGLSCQYESNEQVPLDSLQPYIDDALDLIEFANGATTTKWGKVRADMGHPEPFNLKMIGVGNEQWDKQYVERLELFMKAIRKKYPDIKIVGSSGPSASGDRFDYLWPEMKRLGADLVDEHYYMSPDWFQSNARRYDSYDRKGPKVFAGEYAAHDAPTGKANNLYSALSEAAFMTGLERNADVVHLATYAPLFAHVDAWQWNPDLIWFDNLRMMRTPNYYVQQMYGMNSGTNVLSLTMDNQVVAGQDSLYATAALNSPTGEIIVKIVNTSSKSADLSISFKGMKKGTLNGGYCIYLQNDNIKAINTLDKEEIVPHVRPVTTDGNVLKVQADARSFCVYRLQVKK